MKAAATSDLAKSRPGEYVSDFDTLFAHLIRATSVAEGVEKSTAPIRFGLPMNLPRRLSPTLPPQANGSLIFIGLNTMNYKDIIDGSLGDLALIVRRGHQTNNDELRRVFAWLASRESLEKHFFRYRL